MPPRRPSRGGTGFSQFFGLNDLFQSQRAVDPGHRPVGERRQRLGGGRPDRLVAQGPGRRHRQAGQHHHHRRHDHRQCGDGAEHRDGRRGDLHAEHRRLDLHRHQRALSRLSAERHRRHHPARHHRHELHPAVRHRRQSAGGAGASGFAVNPRDRRHPARIWPSPRRASPPPRVAGDTIVGRATIPAPSRCRMSITATQSFAAAGGIAAQAASLATMRRPSTRMSPPNRTPSPPTRPPRTTGCRKRSRASRPIPASIWTKN